MVGDVADASNIDKLSETLKKLGYQNINRVLPPFNSFNPSMGWEKL
jgi:hypothetical protein